MHESANGITAAIKRVWSSEMQQIKDLQDAKSVLAAKNDEITTLMTRLGDVVGTAELLKVQKDFTNAEKNAKANQQEKHFLELVPRISAIEIVLPVVEAFPEATEVDRPQRDMVKAAIEDHVSRARSDLEVQRGQLEDPTMVPPIRFLLEEQKVFRLEDSRQVLYQEGVEVLASLAALRESRRAVQAPVEALKARRAEVERRQGEVEAKLAALDVQASVTQQGTAAMAAILREKEAQEKQGQKLEELLMPLDKEASGIELELELCDAEMVKYLEELRAEVGTLGNEAERLASSLVQTRKELLDARKPLGMEEAVSDKGMLTRLEETVDSLKEIVNNAEGRREKAEGEFLEATKLNEELKNLQAASERECERLHQEVAFLKTKVVSLEKDKAALESEVANMGDRVSVEDVKKMDAQMFELQQRADVLAGEKTAMEARLRAVAEDFAKAREELAGERRDGASMRSTIEQLHHLLQNAQDASPAFEAAMQRRAIIEQWLPCLTDAARIALQDPEATSNREGLLELDPASLTKLAGQVYQSAVLVNAYAHTNSHPRLRLHEHLYNFFLFKFGQRFFSEINLQGLIHSLDIAAKGSDVGHLRLFRAVLGLDPLNRLTETAEAFFLRLLTAIQLARGRSLESLPGDISLCLRPNIHVKVAVQAVESCFVVTDREETQVIMEEYSRNSTAEAEASVDQDLWYRTPAEVASEIQIRLFDAASGNDGQILPLQEILEIGLKMFREEEDRERRRLQSIMEAESGRDGVPGLIDFPAFVKVVSRLKEEGLSKARHLYREALQLAPTGVAMPEADKFATVLINNNCSTIQYKPPLLPEGAPTTVTEINEMLDSLGQEVLVPAWRHALPKLRSVVRTLKAKVQSAADTMDTATHDRRLRALQTIQQGIVELDMMLESEAPLDLARWASLRDILHRVQALHYQLAWSPKERAMDISGASAFAKLFGNSFSAAQATAGNMAVTATATGLSAEEEGPEEEAAGEGRPFERPLQHGGEAA